MRSVRSLVVAVVLVALAVALADGRVALVVGNSTCAHIQRLPNPDNDARDISAALRRLGFEVTTELDAQSDKFLAHTTNLGSDEEGRFWYFPILYMLSPGLDRVTRASSSRAALPMRSSATGQQTDHPLRAVRALTDEALRSMSTQLERLYSTTGRPWSPPEQLLRALPFQVLYRVRSERLLMEELDYNLPFPVVRRVEHGGPPGARRRGQAACGEEPLS